MSFDSISKEEVMPTEVLFEAEIDSSEEPPMEEWSSLVFVQPETCRKKILFEKGLYHPGSGEICNKYIRMSDSSVLRHPYYNYPSILDPGIEKALLTPEPCITYADDGQERYIAECKEMGQHAVRIFYKGLIEEEINLKFYCINPAAVRAMCLALQHNKIVKVLNLTDNFLDNDASYHLGLLLKANDTLRELNLSGCRIGPHGVARLVDGLLRNKSLETLNLDRNQIGDLGLEYIANAVVRGLRVKNLSLCQNNIAAKSINMLSETLETHNKFVSLDLSWNNLRTLGSTSLFLTKLSESDTIETVDLSWTALTGPRIGLALLRLLKAPNMKNLILSNNKLEGEAISSMITGLPTAKKLIKLDLSYNPLSPKDALNVLKKMNLSKVKLQILDLSNVIVDNEFIKLLKEVQQKKFRKNFKLMFGDVTPSFVPVGLDYREIVLNRAEFLGKKSKKKMVDIALVGMQLMKDGKQIMPIKDFTPAMKSSGAPWDEDLLDAFGDAFAGPQTGKNKSVDIPQMVEYMKRKWPDRKLPPTPPPEPEPEPLPPPPPPKKEKGKKKK